MKLKLDRLADSFKNPHAKEDQTMEQKNQNSVAQCFVPPSWKKKLRFFDFILSACCGNEASQGSNCLV